jgi:alkyl hydroperoxide reductase subunit AhpC
MLRINDMAPDFQAKTTQGTICFHEWLGDSWCVFFSHPKDFTPVCTTELGHLAGVQAEFEKRNCKIIGLSVDPVADHVKWAGDIESTQGHSVNYPMIGDPELQVARLYAMLPADAGETCAGRTAANNATVRTVFMIGPDKKINLMLIYPMTTGRNFDGDPGSEPPMMCTVQYTSRNYAWLAREWRTSSGSWRTALWDGSRAASDLTTFPKLPRMSSAQYEKNSATTSPCWMFARWESETAA